MWRSQPPGSSSSGRYPDVGSQPSVDANSAISRMPIQKSGIDTPNWLATRTIASLTRPSCSADQMPAGSAISSAMTMPTTAERHRRGQPLEQRHRDRIAVAEADAEVTGQRRADVAEELLDDRPVEAACRPQCVVRLRRVARAQRDAHRIARHQVHQREHHDQHADQHDHRVSSLRARKRTIG